MLNIGPRSNMVRQTSEEPSYVMTDFPYVNAPIVVLKSPESSGSPEIDQSNACVYFEVLVSLPSGTLR